MAAAAPEGAAGPDRVRAGSAGAPSRRWLRRLAGPIVALGLVLWLLPRAEPAEPVEEYHMAMGTVVRLALFVDAAEAPALFASARAEIDRLDSLLTHYGDTSEVARVNAAAYAGPVRLSPELAQVLRESLRLARRTGDAFDPAMGALTDLWGFPEASRPPPPAAVDSALACSGWRYVQLDGDEVRFTREGVRLDLGAVAKGYIVDRTVQLLRAEGVPAGVVEAGGDLRFWGVKPDGRPWRFGVQHPRDPSRIVAVDDVGLPALATSGDYEQTFEFEGRRYHHLLDPKTGYPAPGTVSATVWARSAMEADALATATFVLGPQRALAWVDRADSTEVLLFTETEGGLRRAMSHGLEGHVEAD